jgi:MinD-like ATPase involved in chromosome partitioning or flagellar assembly
MLRVATVLSAREWESRLVAAARDTALLKLVLRAFVPDEVTSHASGIDVVVAGSETPWVTPTRVAAWRRAGLRVVGVHARSDRPGADRLRAGGADLVLFDDLDTESLIREIRILDVVGSDAMERSGRLVAVTGAHGSPGVSEVAVALAWNAAGRGDAVLVDADLAAPSIAVRLGLPPRPDLADVVDRSLGEAVPAIDDTLTVGALRVVPGSMRPDDPGLRPDVVVDVVEGLAADHVVVADCGRWPTAQSLIRAADEAVLVVGPSPISIVRLARVVEEWVGPQPSLVVNGVTRTRRVEVVRAVRRWSGLDPVAVIPWSRRLVSKAVTGGEPSAGLRRRLAGVGADT